MRVKLKPITAIALTAITDDIFKDKHVVHCTRGDNDKALEESFKNFDERIVHYVKVTEPEGFYDSWVVVYRDNVIAIDLNNKVVAIKGTADELYNIPQLYELFKILVYNQSSFKIVESDLPSHLQWHYSPTMIKTAEHAEKH